MEFNRPSDKELKFSHGVSSALVANPALGMKIIKVAEALQSLRRTSMTKQAELLPYYDGHAVGYKEGTAAWLLPSKAILQDEAAPAGVLLIALKNVLGPAVLAWEPDTIWVELEDRENLSIPPLNRDKLLAAMTLLEMPAFYWEVNTFQNTVMAFNDTLANTDIIQEATPAYLAWAVYEAELILHEHQEWEPAFDYEPVLYTAECLHRAGFVLAPKTLSFAQESLDVRNGDGSLVTKSEVQAAWDLLAKKEVQNLEFKDEPLDVQLAKLASCEAYIAERVKLYQDFTSRLS